MSLISLSIFVCIRNKKIDHTILNPTLMHKATTHQKQDCRNREGSGVDCVPPSYFGRSVNTINTGGWGIMSTTLLLPPLPRIIKPSYGPARDIDPFDRKVLCLKQSRNLLINHKYKKKLLAVFFHVIHQFSFSLVHKPKSIR